VAINVLWYGRSSLSPPRRSGSRAERDAQAQKEGARSALPPAPTEKTAPPKER
jgi:hypothetical protein